MVAEPHPNESLRSESPHGSPRNEMRSVHATPSLSTETSWDIVGHVVRLLSVDDDTMGFWLSTSMVAQYGIYHQCIALSRHDYRSPKVVRGKRGGRKEYEPSDPRSSNNKKPVGTLREDCSKDEMEEFMYRYIEYKLHAPIHDLQLGVEELRRIGQTPFPQQAKLVEEYSSLLSARMLDSSTCWDDRVGGEDEEEKEPPAWWAETPEALCFSIALSPLSDLSTAPTADNWWDLEVIKESERFTAVAKPACIYEASTSKGLWDASPTNLAHAAARRLPGMPSQSEASLRRGLCNTLERDASGVQIVGRTAEACAHFSSESKMHRVEWEYLALLDGRFGGGASGDQSDLLPAEGIIDVPLRRWRNYTWRDSGSVACCHKGLKAITKYKILGQWKVPATGKLKFWGRERWFTFVQVRALTDRGHQVNSHLAFTGHPIIGDMRYNEGRHEEDCAIVPRMFLHCWRVAFADTDGSTFAATCDLTPDLQASLSWVQNLANQASADISAIKAAVPGLITLLADGKHLPTEGHVPVLADGKHPATEGDEQNDSKASGASIVLPKPVVHSCAGCGLVEESYCDIIRQEDRSCLLWQLRNSSAACQRCDDGPSAASFGAGKLWVPAVLKLRLVSSV